MEPGQQQRTGLPRDKRPDGLWGSSRGRGSRGTFDKLKPDALLSNKNSMNYAKETFRGLNNGFLATPPIKHLALRLERPTDYLLKREFIEKGILCLSLTHAHTRTLSLALTHTLSHSFSEPGYFLPWPKCLLKEQFWWLCFWPICFESGFLNWSKLSPAIKNRATKHFQGKTAD